MTTDHHAPLGVFGGSGFYEFLDGAQEIVVDTPYGPPAGPVVLGSVAGNPVAFMARHGRNHEFAAHRVPYRANMWAMHSVGVRSIVTPCSVGSLQPDIHPGQLVVIDQVVDRTWGRPDTFHDVGGPADQPGTDGPVHHQTFADPYDVGLRDQLVAAGARTGVAVVDGGTMVVINGPRFSTRAESTWFRSMGWHGVVVAHHDRSIASGTDLTGNIDELTWHQLQVADLRAGWSGETIDEPVRIASLEQILTAFPDVMISLEIKQSEPSMAKPLCDVLRRLNAVERVYLSANSDDDVYAAQAECPGSVVITTTYRDVAEMRRVRETDEAWCAPAPIGQPPYSERLLDPENVAWSHDHGMAIFTWTIDDPETLRGLAEAGVDAVYTRRPDIAREVFDEFAAANP